MRALSLEATMSTPIRWQHDRPTRRSIKPQPRQLNSTNAVQAQAARVAFTDPFMLSIERQEIYLRRLPAKLNGLRVVHLSDLHYVPLVNPRHLERAVQAANDLRPDLIALTGDYISQ